MVLEHFCQEDQQKEQFMIHHCKHHLKHDNGQHSTVNGWINGQNNWIIVHNRGVMVHACRVAAVTGFTVFHSIKMHGYYTVDVCLLPVMLKTLETPTFLTPHLQSRVRDREKLTSLPAPKHYAVWAQCIPRWMWDCSSHCVWKPHVQREPPRLY